MLYKVASALALLLLIGDAIFATRAIITIRENDALVSHTLEVQRELHQLGALLLEVENGERGYVATAAEEYLGPYNQAVRAVEDHLDHLQRLTEDNPVQRGLIPAFTEAARHKIAHAEAVVDFEKRGDHESARRLVRTGAGKRHMDELRALLGRMESEESRLLDERQRRSDANTQRIVVIFVLASGLALALVLLTLWAGAREMRVRTREAHAIATREAETRAVQEQLQAVLNASPVGVFGAGTDRKVSVWNPQSEALYGWAADEIIGRELPLPRSAKEQWQELLARLLRGESFVNVETRRVKKSGEEFDALLSGGPVLDDSGRITGFVGAISDATQMVRTRQALQRSEKLAAAGRLAATIAHEINNPLEAVTNLLYLAKSTTTDDQVMQYLRLADEELRRVTHIARQTLGFYRDTSSPERFRVAGVVEEVLSLYDRRLTSKQIAVQPELDREAEVLGSKGEVRQVLTNLISNALDASAPGAPLRVRVRTGQSLNGGDGSGVRIVVADEGTGIPRENLKRVFEPFFTTKADIGTGLGLWVSQEIVQKLGGSIRMRSRTGREHHGTVFSVFIPDHRHAEPVRLATAG